MAGSFIAPTHLDSTVMLATDEDGSADDPNEWIPVKCFLCDHAFVGGEEPWLIFEKRVHEDGHMECALSTILSAALGREVDESSAHSTLLCDACNANVMEFEELEQRFSEIRYRILTAYNRIARLNDLIPIAIEINGVLQTDNDLPELAKVPAPLPPQIQPFTNELSSLKMQNILMDSTKVDEIMSQVEAKVEADAAALVDEVHDDEEEEVDAFMSSEVVSVEDPSKYAFAVIQQEEQQQQQQQVTVTMPLEFAAIKEEALSVPGLHHIDGQDIIIYDEIIEQSTQASYSADEGADNSTGSQSMPTYSQSSQQNVDILYTIDDGGDSINVDDNLQEMHSKRLIRTSRQPPLYQQQNDRYVCLECDPAESLDPPHFVEHMRSVHKIRFYVCELCSAGFLGRQELSDHLEEQHVGSGGDSGEEEEQDEEQEQAVEEATGAVATASSFLCETCHRVFTNYRLFRIHKRMHYNSTKQFECSECHKKYSSRNLLDEHMNMHTGARPYKCSHCPKDFASKYTLQTHLKIHSERSRPFACDECDKTFLNAQNLAAHKRLHVGVKSFVCDVCQKAFGTQHNLNVHKIMHSGARPFICRTCGKSFARRPEVKDHERIHSGERPFKCNLCPLAFAQRSNLQSHKKMTHLNEKLHTCTHCYRSFKRSRLLQYHINAVHTGERPYKCDVCTATFVYPEHQKKHMLIHTGNKPYACEVCGKQFNSRDNRNAHRFVHSDKKPYECLDCGMGFMRKPLLLAHMKHTSHSSDTIIVNQPQISVMGVAASQNVANTTTPLVENDDLSQYMDAVEEAEQDDEHNDKSIQRDECILTPDDDANITAVNGQIIKNEIGDVKYLQFEDLDRDGQQTLTWVDIGNH